MKKIKVLIVEDNADKAARLKQAILDVPYVAGIDVKIVNSSVDAKRSMSESRFDLLILDVQLPTRDGQPIDKNGGLKLWQTICRGKQYLRPSHVIAMTSYKETYHDLLDAFAAESWLLIEYDLASTEWLDQIQKMIEHIISQQNQPSEPQSTRNCTVAIITALSDPEMSAVLRLPFMWKQQFSDTQSMFYYQGLFTKRGGTTNGIVAASPPQMGMPAIVCLTMKIIHEFSPQYIFMPGIAAGLKSAGCNYGDILVPDPCWDWGSGKYSVQDGTRVFQPDPSPLRVDSSLVELCRRLATDQDALANIRDTWPSAKPPATLALRIGPVATGAAVIADEAWVKNIQQSSRKLIGIEMETYGLYYAAAHVKTPRPLVMSLKSVCDFADADKNDAYQHYAAYTSASVLRVLLEKYL